MAEELKEGDAAMYRGIMTARNGQKVKVGITLAGITAATFPDGKCIGCAAKSLTKIEGAE